MDALYKLILELYRAARETPVGEFQDLSLSLVKSQLSFRTAMWGSGETTSNGFVVNSVHLHNEPLDVLYDWASLHRHDSAIDEVTAEPGRAKVFYTPELHRNAADMLDFTQRYGHTNAMIIADLARNHFDGHMHGQWMSVYRADQQAHFGQAEQHILESLMPHLVEALAINRMLGAGQPADSGTAGTRALARLDGTLYHCGKKFTELLREIWPEMKSGRLPPGFMAALFPGKEVMLEGRNIAVSTSILGNMLLLSIRKISPLSMLTQRELAVAKLFGEGHSHKEIAQQLEIAPATVRNFLGFIYRKLNINDKAALAALIKEGNY